MADWLEANKEIRALISDGPNDKLRHRKRVFGRVDGVNLVFKTFEFRRLTDFTLASSPEGVYVDGIAASVSTDDNSLTGEFIVDVAPADGSVVEATYFCQWFTDSELDDFLEGAAQWIGLTDYAKIEAGLRPAALHYAAQECYQKLALKWAEQISEGYRLEDAEGESAFAIVDQYKNAAMDMHKKCFDLRDDFYTRSGKNKQPLFASIPGRVARVVPKR